MAQNQNNQSAPQQDISQLEKVRREKLAQLQAEGKDPFQITKYDQTHHTKEILDHFDEFAGELDEEGNYVKEPTEVSIAGRMLFKRVMGKASFANLQDRDGRIQIYVSRNDLGDDAYAAFKRLDIGDIIGVKGFPFRTKSMRRSLSFFPSLWSRFRRSSTDCRIPISVIARDMWISS